MRTRQRLQALLALGLVTVLAHVAHAQDEQVTRMRTALASPTRPAENKARDAARKPIETVQFLGIKTGQTVIDMVAAGGWFTEVLSAAVGPSGKVYSQNPPFLVNADAEKALVARLGNVTPVHDQLGQAVPAGSVDSASIVKPAFVIASRACCGNMRCSIALSLPATPTWSMTPSTPPGFSAP